MTPTLTNSCLPRITVNTVRYPFAQAKSRQLFQLTLDSSKLVDNPYGLIDPKHGNKLELAADLVLTKGYVSCVDGKLNAANVKLTKVLANQQVAEFYGEISQWNYERQPQLWNGNAINWPCSINHQTYYYTGLIEAGQPMLELFSVCPDHCWFMSSNPMPQTIQFPVQPLSLTNQESAQQKLAYTLLSKEVIAKLAQFGKLSVTKVYGNLAIKGVLAKFEGNKNEEVKILLPKANHGKTAILIGQFDQANDFIYGSVIDIYLDSNCYYYTGKIDLVAGKPFSGKFLDQSGKVKFEGTFASPMLYLESLARKLPSGVKAEHTINLDKVIGSYLHALVTTTNSRKLNLDNNCYQKLTSQLSANIARNEYWITKDSLSYLIEGNLIEKLTGSRNRFLPLNGNANGLELISNEGIITLKGKLKNGKLNGPNCQKTCSLAHPLATSGAKVALRTVAGTMVNEELEGHGTVTNYLPADGIAQTVDINLIVEGNFTRGTLNGPGKMTETNTEGNIRSIWEVNYTDNIILGPGKISNYYPDGKLKTLAIGNFEQTEGIRSTFKGKVQIFEYNRKGKLTAKWEEDR
jgi:hypothetical protein